ncbi:DUF4296 domain-containing protein [Bacteroidales bacterium OttesenSCG-928-A17]|nr:DUF4296 domain-containing protein [Bacteroidales bacterium OttesenSCG-928-A17]
MKLNPIIFFLLLAVFLSACSNRPKGVLSEKKMENLLYDLRLAEAEISNNNQIFSSDSLRKATLLNSVLEKHKVSRTQLDASITWYASNLKMYKVINENLSQRYAENIQSLRDASAQAKDLFLGSEGVLFAIDSAVWFDIYSERNVFPFQIETHLLKYGGALEVKFNILGVNGVNNPELTFCVNCVDTTLVKRLTIDRNGYYSEETEIAKGKRVKDAYGYIYFPEISTQSHFLIYDFRVQLRSENLFRARTHELELPAQ